MSVGVTAHLRVLRLDGVVPVVRHRARPRRGEEAVRPVVRASLGECVRASPGSTGVLGRGGERLIRASPDSTAVLGRESGG